jgi:hypothetical protein
MRKIVEVFISGNVVVGATYRADVLNKSFPLKGSSLVEVSKGSLVVVKKVDDEQVIFSYKDKMCVLDIGDFKRYYALKM